MSCDSSVVSEQGDIFSIEGPYTLNCNESRVFNYIDKITLWTDGIYAATKKYPDFPSHMPVQNYSTTITDYFSYCGWWIGVELWYHAYLQIILLYKDVFGRKKKWCRNRTYLSNFIICGYNLGIFFPGLWPGLD
jgi:hypothetical protein